MNDLRTAAQQALEALEQSGFDDSRRNYGMESAAITALRAALAEPVQEPVAFMVYTEGGTSAYVTDNPNDLVGAYRALPLYPAPQRKPLTYGEISKILSEYEINYDMIGFARAIEKVHGI